MRRAGNAEYELLELRSGAKAHSYRSKAIEACQSATRTDSVRHTDERGSRGERPIRKERLQDSKTPIPPAPLSKGGQSFTSDTDRPQDRGQVFKNLLKLTLQDGPLSSPNLEHDAYGRYFRDVGFGWTGGKEVLVVTDNPALTAQGLVKFRTRMKRLGNEVFGRAVVFKIADEGEAQEVQT